MGDTQDSTDTMEERGGLQMLMLLLMPSLLRIPTCSMDTDWDTMVDTILTTMVPDTTMEDKQTEFKQNTTTTSSNSYQNKIKVEIEVKTLFRLNGILKLNVQTKAVFEV